MLNAHKLCLELLKIVDILKFWCPVTFISYASKEFE